MHHLPPSTPHPHTGEEPPSSSTCSSNLHDLPSPGSPAPYPAQQQLQQQQQAPSMTEGGPPHPSGPSSCNEFSLDRLASQTQRLRLMGRSEYSMARADFALSTLPAR